MVTIKEYHVHRVNHENSSDEIDCRETAIRGGKRVSVISDDRLLVHFISDELWQICEVYK